MFAGTLTYPVDHPDGAGHLLVAWAGSLYFCFLVPYVLKSLIFESGRALWIERGKLIFLNRRFLSANCDEIEKLSFSRDKRGELIVVHLKNGQRKVFPTASLEESGEAIMYQLTDLLEL